MKKNLLIWNVVFYAIQYSVSLLYIGFEYGESSQWPYPCGPEYFVFPAVCLVLLGIGIRLVQEREYCTAKSYCTMAIVTLVYSCLLCGRGLIVKIQQILVASALDIVVYPAVMTVFSVIIAVFYFICAAQTRKETREHPCQF